MTRCTPDRPRAFEGGEEFTPELEGLRVADCGTQHFTGAVDRHSRRHDQRLRHHVGTDANLAESRIGEHVRKLGVGQRALAERGHFVVEAGADAGDLGLGNARGHAKGVDEVIDRARGHSVNVGLHHHCVQGLVDTAASFEQAREGRPGS